MVLVGVPPKLENGATMSQAEFHRLYERAEDLSRVELIEGVVFMPSPIMVPGHSRRQADVLEWLSAFVGDRTDIEWLPPSTVILDDADEVEPDAVLRTLTPENRDLDYILTAPELIVEIANSSASRDMHWKKDAYERNGVLEYVVWRTQDGEIDWFQLRDGRFVRRTPDAGGLIESEVFPGLRLDVAAMLAGDRTKVRAAVRRE